MDESMQIADEGQNIQLNNFQARNPITRVLLNPNDVSVQRFNNISNEQNSYLQQVSPSLGPNQQQIQPRLYFQIQNGAGNQQQQQQIELQQVAINLQNRQESGSESQSSQRVQDNQDQGQQEQQDGQQRSQQNQNFIVQNQENNENEEDSQQAVNAEGYSRFYIQNQEEIKNRLIVLKAAILVKIISLVIVSAKIIISIIIQSVSQGCKTGMLIIFVNMILGYDTLSAILHFYYICYIRNNDLKVLSDKKILNFQNLEFSDYDYQYTPQIFIAVIRKNKKLKHFIVLRFVLGLSALILGIVTAATEKDGYCDAEQSDMVGLFIFLFIMCIIFIGYRCIQYFICLPAAQISGYYDRRRLRMREDSKKKFIKNLKTFTLTKQEIKDLKNQDTVCCICLGEYTLEEKLLRLPCKANHFFHDQCVQEWLKLNMNCPYCKQQFMHEIQY